MLVRASLRCFENVTYGGQLSGTVGGGWAKERGGVGAYQLIIKPKKKMTKPYKFERASMLGAPEVGKPFRSTTDSGRDTNTLNCATRIRPKFGAHLAAVSPADAWTHYESL